MDLACSLELGRNYHSNAQIARVVTEGWVANQMYCAACSSDSLTATLNNCPGIDFTCPKCALPYQLKSQKSPVRNRIVDAAYDAMIRAIRSEQVPNLFLLRYSPAWSVLDLLLVPSFFLTESAIEKRRPLSANARRAGWVGCNILLNNIPQDGRISVVSNGVASNASMVREEYERIRPLSALNVKMRGWTLDVLNVLRRLGQKDVSLSDLYNFERDLQSLHPNNKNITPKIRQQLQVLRDLGYLSFEGNGRYHVLH